jgi:hypothetical protein
MKLKTLLTANAVLSGACAIFAILAPGKALSIYGVESGPAANLMGQYAGMGSITVALGAWLARNVEGRKAQQAVIAALLITNVIGVILSVLGTLSGVMKTGWPVVGLYLMFALAYSYFQFSKRNG